MVEGNLWTHRAETISRGNLESRPDVVPSVNKKFPALLTAFSVTAALVGLNATAASTPAGAATPPSGAAATLAKMTLPERVGQLFMVGTPATAASSAALKAISTYHVGSIMLTGRSFAGVAATKKVTAALASRASSAKSAARLFIATDQEGGAVQVLQGPGFLRIASALTQGTYPTARLHNDAVIWGQELGAAGVNVDLAPVADTVASPAAATHNPPIGYYHREFGYSTAVVASHAAAFAQGLARAGVSATVKHFPGLGRVTANTDTTAGVTDSITTRHDPYVSPFATVAKSTPFLMMSTAIYRRIDHAHPAAFSHFIITTMVRADLGFKGVVISDDLGNARQVAGWTPGSRALQLLAAGGDMVLTVNSSVLPAMYQAVLSAATSSATFRTLVNAAALRVLTAKENRGLLLS